jgi:hypothetical protein
VNSEDRDWKQTLPRDLDNDQDYYGRQHVGALLAQRAQAGQSDVFINASRSFLLVMTHTALVDCLSVDTYVGSLYNFVSGASGTRAVPFFQHLCETLTATRMESIRVTPFCKLDSTLIALTTAVSEVLRREPRARFNNDLPGLVNSLETAAKLITEEESILASSMVISQVGNIREVIARACGLICKDTNIDLEGHLASIPRSTYPRDIDIPGQRHDNDKIDITKISIFPTQEEILSDAREFLPCTDPDQPHFLISKVERHIDTHFRLLRHDSFGKLKDALGVLMKTFINDPNQLKSPGFELGETRIHPYPHAFVSYLMLNRHGRLQARMSFPQPSSIRRRSTADRRKWWEESRRLEEGVLLSYIWIRDSTVQHMFFTVAERSTQIGNDDSLNYNDKTAVITVKLTTADQSAVKALFDLSRQKIRGVLFEISHVLPATFVPVLESLQNMQRLSRLPFRQWIVPDPVNGRTGIKHDIPPPLYARDAGFTFPIESILSQRTNSMSLHPSSSDNDPLLLAELEARTELDHGQCTALVAALTREFAFVQGPPGTGKSYLGIKLMQILLDTKSRASLGPIVVV